MWLYWDEASPDFGSGEESPQTSIGSQVVPSTWNVAAVTSWHLHTDRKLWRSYQQPLSHSFSAAKCKRHIWVIFHSLTHQSVFVPTNLCDFFGRDTLLLIWIEWDGLVCVGLLARMSSSPTNSSVCECVVFRKIQSIIDTFWTLLPIVQRNYLNKWVSDLIVAHTFSSRHCYRIFTQHRRI